MAWGEWRAEPWRSPQRPKAHQDTKGHRSTKRWEPCSSPQCKGWLFCAKIKEGVTCFKCGGTFGTSGHDKNHGYHNKKAKGESADGPTLSEELCAILRGVIGAIPGEAAAKLYEVYPELNPTKEKEKEKTASQQHLQAARAVADCEAKVDKLAKKAARSRCIADDDQTKLEAAAQDFEKAQKDMALLRGKDEAEPAVHEFDQGNIDSDTDLNDLDPSTKKDVKDLYERKKQIQLDERRLGDVWRVVLSRQQMKQRKAEARQQAEGAKLSYAQAAAGASQKCPGIGAESTRHVATTLDDSQGDGMVEHMDISTPRGEEDKAPWGPADTEDKADADTQIASRAAVEAKLKADALEKARTRAFSVMPRERTSTAKDRSRSR